MNEDELPEGTTLIEIREIYDGWPVMGFIARQLYFLFMMGWNI